MHVQNKAFGNIGFQSTWVFGSHELDVEDGDDASVTIGGGEEDLRCLEMEPEVLLRCDGGFRRWSSSGELYDTEAEAGQERQQTMLT